MQEQDGCEVEMKESWKVCEGLQGWLRKRWWWWWWSCDSTFNIWLEKGVLGKTRNRPSFFPATGGVQVIPLETWRLTFTFVPETMEISVPACIFI